MSFEVVSVSDWRRGPWQTVRYYI